MRARRSAAAAVVLLFCGSAACTGDDSSAPGSPPASGAPSADAVPQGVDPAWLVRSTGTRESTEYTSLQQALFVDGDVGVYAANDTMLGLSLKDGSTVWSNPIDLRGEVPFVLGQQPTKDHHWHFGSSQPYEAGERRGDRLYTIDVRDGTVVNDVEAPNYDGQIVNVEGTDYLAMDDAVHRITAGGELEKVWTIPSRLSKVGRDIDAISPVAGTSIVTLSLDYFNGSPLTFVGLDVATGTELWVRGAADFQTKPLGALVDVRTGPDGRLLIQRYTRDQGLLEWTHVWLIDPKTGKTRFHRFLETASHEAGTHEHGYLLWGAGTHGDPHGLQLVGDDLILRDRRAPARYSIAEDKELWRHDVGKNTYLGPLTPDGRRIIVNVPGYTTGSFLLLDASTGEAVADWGLPEEYAEGLAGSPLMALTDEGLLLGRNQDAEGGAVAEDGTATDALNDAGFFRYRY